MNTHIPLDIKNETCYSRKIFDLFDKSTYKVQVNYLFWDNKTKQIIKIGSSRPNGINTYYRSIHAEITAIKQYGICKNKNIVIIIWKFDIYKYFLPCYSCLTCTKTINKYNFNRIIFTIKNNKLVSSIINNPEICFGLQLKYNNK